MICERSQFKKMGLAFPKLNPLLPFFCGVLRESCFKAPKVPWTNISTIKIFILTNFVQKTSSDHAFRK